jgi:predicted RNase H-like HicB family nuclease/DNA-binding XRE family transcriptional regulator
MKYHFKVHKEGKRFWAECLELEGCFTQADSMQELQKMMQEALNLYICEPEDSTRLANLPNQSIKKSKNIVEVPVNAEIAFSFLVRYHRIKHGMTQHQAAKKLGFDSINSYQRLERKKCNPNLKTISRIKAIFPEFSLDFAVA